jgi:hypothetical protein
MGIHDIPDCLFKNNDPSCGIIQFKKLPRDCRQGRRRMTEFAPIELEPDVPLELVDGRSFCTNASFSFVFAAQSPNYTPPTADHILEVIRQFIDEAA